MTDSETQIENVSDTALWVAHHRSLESHRSDSFFKDPLAGLLSGEKGAQLATRMGQFKMMSWIMAVRTVIIDRFIYSLLKEGVDTVVNLGAGLDTRPYRMDLPSSLRWVEIDFPPMIEMKTKKLKDQIPKCQLERISLDLSKRQARQEIFQRLSGESKKILVITEGVIIYLTNQQAAELADDLHASPHFEFWIQDFLQGDIASRVKKNWGKKLQRSPFQFVTKEWFPFFARHGWKLKQKVGSYEAGEELGRAMPIPWIAKVLMKLSARARKQLIDASGYAVLRR